MKRVFFFTGYHMKVFEFEGNRFCAGLDFRDDEESIERFKLLLEESRDISAYLLVDLLDEDYQIERVPHVRGRDKQELVKRLERKIFRDAEYHHTLNLPRMKEGRKDDQILFSTLANVPELDKWMDLFKEFETPLAGIWSVPFLGEKVLHKLGVKEENVLLLSRQMRSAIRETVFKSGKVIISRQAKLERTVRSEKSAETTSTIVASNVDIMQRFLVNQRTIAFNDTLHAYALVADEFTEQCSVYCESTATLKFHFIGLQSMFDRFGMKGCEGQNADVLFAYLCTLSSSSKQQYLHGERRVPYLKNKIDQAIKTTVQFGSVASLVLAAFLYINSIEVRKETDALYDNLSMMQERYEAEFSEIQSQVETANLVAESVSLVQRIDAEAELAPHKLFYALGKVLGDERYIHFKLTNMDWRKYSPGAYSTLIGNYKDLSKIEDPEGEEYDDYDDYEEQSDSAFRSALIIKGELDIEKFNYSHAVVLSESFVASLENIPGVELVQLLTSPVDVRAGSRFSDRVGLDAEQSVKTLDKAIFEYRLVFYPKKAKQEYADVYSQ
jgi:hypothetical protein